MEGVTVGPFVRVMSTRRLVRAWLTPFIRISTGAPGSRRLMERLADFVPGGFPIAADAVPVVVQLMGVDTALLAATAARLAALGVSAIDLNCACPSKTVVGNGAGGARLAEPAWICETLVAIRDACPGCGVSVKLRSGVADAKAELPGILAAVQQARPDFVVLHHRTVREGYRDAPDGWERIATARELLPDIPLIASGDVFTVEDAMEIHRRTCVDGVAPARGLLRNPWLLDDIRACCHGRQAPTRGVSERLEFLRDICADAMAAKTFRRNYTLELARNLFGPESEHFLDLAKAESPQELLRRLG